MVSGIGPAETLKKHNFSVVNDLPGVGQNMHDTANIGGITFPVNTLSTTTIKNNATLIAQATHDYLSNQSGILRVGSGDYIVWEKFPSSYLANLSTSTQSFLSRLPADWPEVEYVVDGNGRSLESGSSTFGTNYASIGLLLIATASRGNVTISSNSMTDKPVFSTNWLLDERDQDMAVAAYRRGREIWSKFNPSVVTGPESAPGTNVTTYEQILNYVRTEGVSAIHHATSTFKCPSVCQKDVKLIEHANINRSNGTSER